MVRFQGLFEDVILVRMLLFANSSVLLPQSTLRYRYQSYLLATFLPFSNLSSTDFFFNEWWIEKNNPRAVKISCMLEFVLFSTKSVHLWSSVRRQFYFSHNDTRSQHDMKTSETAMMKQNKQQTQTHPSSNRQWRSTFISYWNKGNDTY